MVILASFWKHKACGQTVLPARSVSTGQKLVENAKFNKSNATFWVIFKQRKKMSEIFARLFFFLLQKDSCTHRWCKRLMFILAECNLAGAAVGLWLVAGEGTAWFPRKVQMSAGCSVASIIQGYNNFSIEKSRSCIFKIVA